MCELTDNVDYVVDGDDRWCLCIMSHDVRLLLMASQSQLYRHERSGPPVTGVPAVCGSQLICHQQTVCLRSSRTFVLAQISEINKIEEKGNLLLSAHLLELSNGEFFSSETKLPLNFYTGGS